MPTSARDQLAALLAEQVKTEAASIRDFKKYMETDGKSFINKLESLIGQTVPGSNFENIYSSILTMINNVSAMADEIIASEDKAATQVEQPAKDAPVTKTDNPDANSSA